MKKDKVNELLLEALETEKGGVQVYETALRCVQNEELREEWEKYLEETTNHVKVLEDICRKFGLDPTMETPGRKVVRHIGKSLVEAMELALQGGDPDGAQIVAAECVTEAETKDHMNWELIGFVAEKAKGEERKILKEAYEEIEEQEDEHLYHTKGWARELHVQALGLPAVIPPPEEEKDVKSAIGAERAKKARKDML